MSNIFYTTRGTTKKTVERGAKGFSAVEVVIVLALLALAGFGGWYVWHKKQQAAPAASTTSTKDETNTEGTRTESAYTLPDGYVQYDDEELGFSFAYPEEYGVVTPQPEVNSVRILANQEPETAFGPGITGRFQVFTYTTADPVVTSRKYGPQIQLQNGKWIVTEANEFDTVGNKAGDEYKTPQNKVPTSQKNGELTVYTFGSGDEGSTLYRLAFVVKGKLHELYLPTYSDGMYTGGEENDSTTFDAMLKEVRDSVRLLQ